MRSPKRKAMSKKILWAQVRVPEYPRVRFFAKSSGARLGFADVTGNVTKLVIEDLEDESGYYALLRLNAQDKLVWRTTHPSLQETKWQVEFEYGLPEEKWTAFTDSAA